MIRLPLQMGMKWLHLQFSDDGSWLLWLYHNRDMTRGSYVAMRPNGHAELVTIQPSGLETTIQLEE